MRTSPKTQKAQDYTSAQADKPASGGVASESGEQGRRLLLKFIGGDKPELDRIECRWSKDSKSGYWQQGDAPENSPMAWTPVPQALALIFLDYLSAAGTETVGPVFFSESNSGGLAISLGNAIHDKDGKLHELFVERLPSQFPASRVKQAFAGKTHGKDEKERRIFVRSDNLPPDCIEIYWVLQGPGRITDSASIRELARRIRVSLGIPVEERPPIGEGQPEATPPSQARRRPTTATELLGPSTKPTQPEARPPAQPSAPLSPNQPAQPIPISADALVESLFKKFQIGKGREQAQEQPSGPPKAKPGMLSDLEGIEVKTAEQKTELRKPKFLKPSSPPTPPIDPALFQITNPMGLAWDDSHPLLDFGSDDSGEDIWRLKDACEGVLVLGAPGSGKTSASAFALAGAFLTAGFGGLVLCAKPEEARRWQSLCERFGRAQDCIVIRPGGPHKLNVLAYETQRPGDRIGLTDDLIAFFRVLIAVVSKRAATQGKDDFWINATNQLMRALFDLFLLAGEPMSIDSLTEFVTQAPEEPGKLWETDSRFGSVLSQAEARVKSPEDERIFRNAYAYWTQTYPGIADATRSGIVLGFTAMANALSGRGIHDLISSETTLTPEMILSGKIVILDLPLKECGQGGLMVQAAWKYLFQRAVERRADKGRQTARPAFLWSDEGHLFFSQHDIDFQPTARDCRTPHVIISQSLHNFYQLGHNPHAVQGVFATMNTHIYHANGDLETNKWSSEKLGTAIKTLVNVSISSQPKHPTHPKHWLLDMFKQDERESTSSTSVNQHRETIFQPETFSQLKKGGDGTCQAVVLWVSHKFRCNQGRPFRVTVFEQDNNQLTNQT